MLRQHWIQTYTGNEWLENKHDKQYIRRTWKKLHIAAGNNGIITGATITHHNKDDRSQVEDLLKNIKNSMGRYKINLINYRMKKKYIFYASLIMLMSNY